ncbi:MAG: type II toxin-antitoxin system death-on-curing family toxin [Methanoregula sp.]|jgi:death-on-curing protein|uniref:type II toxin-antitoxin system death-on-curing family toxin n=1 Tax=Methanoregula sp. TaxID=2052170 RepID=UPI003BAE23A6
MEKLSVEKIIEIHNDIIEDFGGEHGVRDLATIEYLIYRLERKSSVFHKAAIALHAICTDHPFIDGNKRTAFVVADNLLKESGYRIQATDDEVVSFMLEVAQYTHTMESVKKWIKKSAVLQTA